MDLPVAVRALRDSDRAYVIQSWVRDLRRNGPRWARVAPRALFAASVPARIAELVDRVPVLIAAPQDDDYTILGWAAVSADPPRVWHVYVKGPFRGFGLGRRLLSAVWDRPAVCCGLTRVARQLRDAGKVPESWVFEEEGLFDGP